MEVAGMNLPVMQEEIFGPILPVIEYSSLEDIENIIALNPNPLGFYLFSTNKETVKRLIRRIPFGGGCINDTLDHAINHHLPFGGRGTSGIGAYHGIYSFNAFSHKKSVLKKGFAFDMGMKYPPYKDGHTMMRKFLLK
jgi:aldehyde dehydrogenase (NAD+)